MIPNDSALLIVRSMAISPSERLYSATDENRCRDPQPNIRQSLREPCRKREKKDCRSQKDQEHHKKITESTDS